MPPADRSTPEETHAQTWALAVVFGLVSVPWTWTFEQVAGLPLWPAFIASATYFASQRGARGLIQGLAGNVGGVVYAMATLAIVAGAGFGPVGLSLLVGAGMFLASLHPFIDVLAFAPAAFFGYATAFSVHAADVALGAPGLTGQTLATVTSLAIGALIGWGADRVAGWLATRHGGSHA